MNLQRNVSHSSIQLPHTTTHPEIKNPILRAASTISLFTNVPNVLGSFCSGAGQDGEEEQKKRRYFFSSSFFRQRLNVPSGWDKDAWPNEQKREKKIPGENIKDGQEKNTVRLRDATSATNSRTKLSSNTYLFSLPTWWQRRLSD